jgi:hypothetical protein
MSEHMTPEHEPAACEAITAELVRLTLGCRPGRESWHLSVELAARMRRLGQQWEEAARRIGEAMIPSLTEAAAAMQRLFAPKETR